MVITKMSLPRRTFLRGIGAAVALPLLDAMVPALSALARTAAKPALRLGFVYVPNGMQLDQFLPQSAGAGFETTPILSPLASARSQLLVVSGLANAQADPMELGGGPHTRAHAVWLSGSRPKRTQGSDIRAGTTIDQFAARHLGKETPLSSLELALEPNFTTGNCESGYSCTYINTFSWRSPTMPLPMENNPYVVFERLFGDGSGRSARIAQMRTDRSILDAVTGEMAQLQRRLGSRDRTTVTEYFESVREVETRLQKAAARARLSPAAPVDRPLGIPDTFEEHATLMFDLQFLAYQADITRVVSLQIARELSTRSYPQIGVSEAHHDVSHHGRNPAKMAQNTKINVHHMNLFAHLVEKMRTTPDGDGTLLDHSIVLYGGGMGDGDQHRPHDLPVLLVGGGCGRLKGGRHVKLQPDTPMMNLGLTLLDKVGVELESIGDSTGRVSDV